MYSRTTFHLQDVIADICCIVSISLPRDVFERTGEKSKVFLKKKGKIKIAYFLGGAG
jgi:hypothetical protein